jgi:hypothetical protein
MRVPGLATPAIVGSSFFSERAMDAFRDYFIRKSTFGSVHFFIRVTKRSSFLDGIEIELFDDLVSEREGKEAGSISLSIETILADFGRSSRLVVDLAGVEFGPNLRGRGIMKRFLRDLIEALRSFSSNPEDRIELLAVNDEVEYPDYIMKRVGGYIWPIFGFDMEDRNPVSQKSGSFQRLKEGFIGFLERNYRVTPDPLSEPVLTDAEYDHLVSLIRRSNYTWELGLLDTRTEIGRPIGNQMGKLGKEFLLSLNDCGWSLVLFYNRPESPGMIRFLAHTSE